MWIPITSSKDVEVGDYVRYKSPQYLNDGYCIGKVSVYDRGQMPRWAEDVIWGVWSQDGLTEDTRPDDPDLRFRDHVLHMDPNDVNWPMDKWVEDCATYELDQKLDEGEDLL